ncbi:MAG TPA: 2-dehydropantoate 2-reductase N-terminal domain-containing protein [Myxococcales bacterium]|nr:2-dehydropantoate 2-reductase N-terminal domain-containing protein [Myxococcales bacterium]
MRIGVIGLGAIGGVVVQRLGVPVDVAARRSERLPAASYDLILLCTRTQDLEGALQPAAPLLAPDGAVVCLQNGLPEERAAKLVGPSRVLGAVIGWSASRGGEVTGRGKFTLGGASPRLPQAAELLQRVFPVKVTQNLAGARWSKLAMNCAISTLGAVSGFTLGELAASREVRALALRVIAEVVDVARERGVQMEAVSGLRPDLLVRWPLPLQHLAVWLAVRGRTRQRTGMIALLEQGRPSGIEDLNALIPRPLNQRLVTMVREIEQKKRSISPANLAELA